MCQGRPVKRRVKPPEGRKRGNRGRKRTEEGRAKIEEAEGMWVAQRGRATHATSEKERKK